MAISFQQRQAQRQVFSPAMIMESSLLQLPAGELVDEVRKELSSNPALEAVSSVPGRMRSSAGGDANRDWMDNIADSRGETLDEHLIGELRMDGVGGRELDLCRAIVAELDSDGRFRGELPSMMMVTGATEQELENARKRIMAIDPAGCGARDLAECYLAQLGDVPEPDRADVEKAIGKIAACSDPAPSFGFSPMVVKYLKKMNPFPGRLFDYRPVELVVPDVVVDEDGEVFVDQGDVPDVVVSAKYIAMAKDADLDEETRNFAAERVRRARNFKDALVRRRETLERIAKITVSRQLSFVRKGPSALKKLTMGDVAKEAKCTISSVSRAASRKYVKTPRGVIPLRRFFSLCDGAMMEALKKAMGRKSPSGRPSDREISEQMLKSGFKMARRTVAKYRLLMEKGGRF